MTLRNLPILGLACGALAGCLGGPASPCAPAGFVITTVSGGRLRAIDPEARCDLFRIDLGDAVEGSAVSPSGAKMYAGVKGEDFRNELVAVDIRKGEIAWRLQLGDAGQPHVIDGIGLISGEVLAISLDGARLYLWRAVRADTEGVVAMDLATQHAVAFGGPWNVAAQGLVPVPPTTAFPTGVLAVVGARSSGGPRRQSAVYLLDPISLSLIDSIPASVLGSQQDIWQVVPAPDGQSLYIAGSSRVVRYDLTLRQPAASAPRPSSGSLVVTPDGSTLVVTDVGTWPDSPGSGLLFLYGPNLEDRGTIDVSTPLGGEPGSPTATRTGLAAGDPDERTIYVRAGSDPVGPLYPAQPARILVVDVLERRLRGKVELGGYGLGSVFVASR